jgi:hypothetical protein
MRHVIETRMKGHHSYIQLYHPHKLAMDEQSINLGHCIHFHDTSILAKKSGHTECIIRELTENEFHHDNINKKEGFSLCRLWKTLFQTMNEQKNILSKEK